MKTIFDKATEDELISRINSLTDESKAQWGKMNVHQMIKHCLLADEHFLGMRPYSRTLLGRIIGRLALKQMLKDASPMARNAPTRSEFKISETTGDLAEEKKQWIVLIKGYEKFSDVELTHWFFGRMTKEQLGQFAYKHNDHHLRQFGV
jgi:hypothetical protein